MALDNYEQLNPTSQLPDQPIPVSNVHSDQQGSSDEVQGQDDGLDQDLVDVLKDFIKDFKRSEEVPRDRILRICKKGDLYWDGIQRIFWDEDQHDYRTPEDLRRYFPNENIDPDAYDKFVNIYKAHGESIISALSAEIPTVRFFPDDADIFEDVLTAKAFSQVARIIQRQNDAQILFIRLLFILFNQGLVAGYNYIVDDEKAKPNVTPIQGEENQILRALYCPDCGTELGESQLPPHEAARSNPPDMYCPNCDEEKGPEFEDVPQTVPVITGEQVSPKKKEVIELFGPTHVQIPHYVSTQDQCPILILKTDQHRGLVEEVYGEKAHLVRDDRDNYKYDRWARAATDDYGELPEDVGTLEQVWIRTWVFNVFADEYRDRLKAKFPNGAYCVFFNDEYIFSNTENLDDHWTLTVSPISSKIHAQPIGYPIQPIQDMTNEMKNLTLETVRYGIPETFVDTEVVSLRRYKQSEIRPGQLIPARPRPGHSLGEGFHTVKAASISREVEPFTASLNEDAQFTSGAFPSIYGGALEGGSGTLGEYNASRSQALQRLQITWKIAKVFWAKMMEKSVRDFVNNMESDTKEVIPNGKDSYMNVWVRRREMMGEVGKVEPDASEHFPVSWAQRRDILLNLLQLQNPNVDMLLFHSENRGLLAEAIGFNTFYIPGDDQRNRQLDEIGMLIRDPNPQIIQIPGEMGQVGELILPSVDIEAGVDDDEIHITTCVAFLMSPMGYELKQLNPGAYMNIVAHKEMHEYHQNKAMMFAAPAPPEGPPQVNAPGEGGQSTGGQQVSNPSGQNNNQPPSAPKQTPSKAA